MMYSYRWYYAVISILAIFFIAYLYDIQPAYSHLIRLRNEYASLIEKQKFYDDYPASIENHMDSGAANISAYHPEELLSTLSGIGLQSGVQIHLLKILSHKMVYHMNLKKIRVHLVGTDEQIFSFINSFEKYSLFILNFTYQTINPGLSNLLLDVLAVQNNINEKLKVKLRTELVSEVPSLQKLKMVGYLRQGQNSLAMVMLENHAMRALKAGDQLGLEFGVVKKIMPNGIVFSLPNQKFRMINMEQIKRD